MPAATEAIVFDFFGVICAEITPFVLPQYLPGGGGVERWRNIVERADLGEIDLPQVLELLSAMTGAAPAALEAQFWAAVKIDAAVVALIESLKPRYRIALLSNAMHPFLVRILEKYDLARLFEVRVISCYEHLIKPDPAIYRLTAERLGVAQSACFFTDDNAGNIAAATAAGMQASRFIGADQLKADLAAAGIL